MTVSVQCDQGIRTVVINRPEGRKAVDPTTADAIVNAIMAFEAESYAHLAVLAGGHDVYCAGRDLKYAPTAATQERMSVTRLFGVHARRVGSPCSTHEPSRLARLVGEGRPLEISLSGREVAANECHAVGLCKRLVPSSSTREHALELAHTIPRQCSPIEEQLS